MSAGKIHGCNYLACDGPSCHEYVEAERPVTSLHDLWLRAQGAGWTRRDTRGETAHYCGDCSEPFGDLSVVNGRSE